MNFDYEILKFNDHEPSINVKYSKLGEDDVICKVYYDPDLVSGEYIADTIVAAVPVGVWDIRAKVAAKRAALAALPATGQGTYTVPTPPAPAPAPTGPTARERLEALEAAVAALQGA